MQAAQLASDSHRYERLWEHKVPEQMIPWESGTETDIDNQIEIEAGHKAHLWCAKTKQNTRVVNECECRGGERQRYL